jgi:hypothetical protein
VEKRDGISLSSFGLLYQNTLDWTIYKEFARHQWLTPIILTTWEAEIGKIICPGQPTKIACEILSPKEPEQKAVRMVQVVECLPSKHEAPSSK